MTTQNGLGAQDFDTAFQAERIAQENEIDILGHVNNTVYVRWVQDIAVDHWQTIAKGNLLDNHVWICLRHEIDYRAQLLAGDKVSIRTWLGERAGPRFDRYVDIRKTGAKRWSAQAKTTWVMIERQSGKPKRVGDDVLAAFGLDLSLYQ